MYFQSSLYIECLRSMPTMQCDILNWYFKYATKHFKFSTIGLFHMCCKRCLLQEKKACINFSKVEDFVLV